MPIVFFRNIQPLRLRNPGQTSAKSKPNSKTKMQTDSSVAAPYWGDLPIEIHRMIFEATMDCAAAPELNTIVMPLSEARISSSPGSPPSAETINRTQARSDGRFESASAALSDLQSRVTWQETVPEGVTFHFHTVQTTNRFNMFQYRCCEDSRKSRQTQLCGDRCFQTIRSLDKPGIG